MTVTVRQLADWVRGEVLGDGDLPIAHARALAEAEPGDITFVADEKHLREWHASQASAAVVPATFPVNGRPVIRVADPLAAFVRIVVQLRGPAPAPSGRVDPAAHVDPTAALGPGVTVGPFAVVGARAVVGENTVIHAGATVGAGCVLGADVVLHPRVVLYPDCRLADRVVVHANAVIGADGFGYRPQDGRHAKVPQLGWVEIDEDVEIGACTTIDRGTFGPTRVGAGTKIDNLVQVGHNCRIGRHNILAGQVGIGGSTTTGDYVILGGQVGVSDHVEIGAGAVVGAQGGVTKDLAGGLTVWGTPAAPAQEYLRRLAALGKLPAALRDLDRLKRHLEPGGACAGAAAARPTGPAEAPDE